MRRIGIFGGTFNPIHNGHVLAMEEFAEKMQLDLLYVIPASIPPHKEVPPDSADAQARLAMVKASVRHLPYALVSDIELCREGKSYTSDTLRQLKQLHPDDELFLLMGTDSFLNFDRWHEPDSICTLATIVCAHRQTDCSDELAAQAAMLKEKFHAKCVILDNRFEEVSSSEVRRMLAFDCAQTLIPAPAFEIIQEKGLYQVRKNRKKLTFKALKEQSLLLHDEKRIPHVIGCSQTAVKLARKYGADIRDARRAGILHDITKALSTPAQLLLCKKYGISLDSYDYSKEKLLHAKTGAVIAKTVFGENENICDAIFWHTTGKADMNLLEKIIYIADYVEPNRDFPSVDKLRALAWTDLDAAMQMGLEMTIDLLHKRGKVVDENSLAAWTYFSRREKEKK